MRGIQDTEESIVTVEVLGSPMEVFLFLPAGTGPHPGLVLAQHIPVGHSGIENDEFTLTTARRFARDGYCVAVPFIFHWWPKDETLELKREQSRDDWQVADMKAAFEVLQDQSKVDASRIGIAGHCWGGRVAWLAACHIPACSALAVFYGGNIGKALGQGNTAPLSLASDIDCPVIGFFGNDDSNPSPEDVKAYSKTLTEAGVAHSFHQYEGAGHAFQNFPVPERYRAEASEDAWQKVLAFFRQHLQ